MNGSSVMLGSFAPLDALPHAADKCRSRMGGIRKNDIRRHSCDQCGACNCEDAAFRPCTDLVRRKSVMVGFAALRDLKLNWPRCIEK